MREASVYLTAGILERLRVLQDASSLGYKGWRECCYVATQTINTETVCGRERTAVSRHVEHDSTALRRSDSDAVLMSLWNQAPES